ncbi:MAG: hypothetical protein [Siphoviridae sp. cttb18]|nr:MAG: hypothetical protein [Siphoviridae sp. cttb18]
MPLLNYTTQIDVEKTIAEIQKNLSTHGAQKIMTDYEDGYVKALTFVIPFNDRLVGFRLPTDWKPVLTLLEQDLKVPRRLCTQEQAVKVAWRIVKDWIEAQMAIVDTKMVRMQDVFLPYAITKEGITLAEKFDRPGSNLLGSG